MSSNQQPCPIFILQNSKQISSLLFSSFHNDILYSGNREGDLVIYDLKHRRALFNHDSNGQAILGIADLASDNFLTYTRNGSVYQFAQQSNTEWTSKCNYILKVIVR